MRAIIEGFIEFQGVQRKSPNTLIIYRRHLKSLVDYLESLDPPCPLVEVDHKVLMGFIIELVRAKSIAASTQESYITSLRGFFRWAHDGQGAISENPAAELQYPSRRPA